MPILKIRAVADFTNLRITTPDGVSSDGDTIAVLGRTAIGDGGGGIFSWDEGGTGVDDDWAIVSSYVQGGGRWTRISVFTGAVASTHQVVASIAALRSANGAQGAIAELLGYATTGDGGEGVFDWDATVTAANDDGGTIIFATNVGAGGWRRRYSGALNVMWFGAKGDGVTSDSAAIAAAIAAATTRGGVVSLPPGVFAIGVTVNLNPDTVSGVRLVGSGMPSRIASNPGTWLRALAGIGGPVLRIVGSAFPLFASIGVEELGIDGIGQATHGVEIGNVVDVFLKGLFIRRATGNGIFVSAQTSQLIARRLELAANTAMGLQGASLADSHLVQINAYQNGTVGIQIAATTQLSEVHCYQNGTVGVRIAGDRNNLSGIRSNDNNTVGILVDGDNNVISDLVCWDNGQGGGAAINRAGLRFATGARLNLLGEYRAFDTGGGTQTADIYYNTKTERPTTNRVFSAEVAILDGVYDYSTDGGAQGDVVLATLPDNAIILQAWYEILTTFNSAGAAQVAFGVDTDDAAGLKVAVAFNDASYGAGLHDFIPDGQAANATTKTTAERAVIMTISGADLNQGKVHLWCEYVVSE